MELQEKKSFAESNLKYWEEKKDLLTNYLALTKTLYSESSPYNLPEIFKLLNQRQKIMSEIEILDNLLTKIKKNRNLVEDPEKRFLSENIKNILSEIQYLDNQLSQKFVSWREDVRKELMANQLTLKTLHTYAQTFTSPVTPRFLDLRQ
ncbi:MAG: hypothetical protein ACPL5I_00380 [Thermodesulfobacteriota bacterium]